MVNKMLALGFLLVLTSCSSRSSVKQDNINLNFPEVNRNVVVEIGSQVLNDKGEILYNSMGSGFFFERKYAYVVTAKHVIFDDYDNFNSTKIVISFHRYLESSEERWTFMTLDLKVFQKANRIYTTKSDIVAIKISDSVDRLDHNMSKSKMTDLFTLYSDPAKGHSGFSDISPVVYVFARPDICTPFKDVDLTADVILFGFPSELKEYYRVIEKSEPVFDTRRPLFKKGIVAGKNENTKSIIISGDVYHGNSGGPVFEITYHTGSPFREFRLIGLLTQYIPYFSEVYLESKKKGLNVGVSGYSVAESIDGLIDLLETVEDNPTSH